MKPPWAAVLAVVLVAGCQASTSVETTAAPPSQSASASATSPTAPPSPTLPSIAECADLFEASDGRIAFTVQEGSAAGIATINADGSGFELVVEPGPAREQPHAGTVAPGWLPDGRILFTSNRAGGPDDFHLFIVDPGAGDPERLTNEPDQIEFDGAISADGSTLAYAVALATGDPAEPFRDVGIVLSDAHGGDAGQVTFPPKGTFDQWPDISPDGTKLAFSRGMGGDPGSALGSINVVNLDGTTSQGELTDPELDAIRPRWSPDGQWLLFSSNADNYATESANVWVVRSNGTGLRQLTFESGMSQAFFPDWSPDGQHIVYLHHRAGSGTQDLSIMALDGGPGCTLWEGTSSQLAGDPDWGQAGAE
jgi:Tol biopolymer transport system component